MCTLYVQGALGYTKGIIRVNLPSIGLNHTRESGVAYIKYALGRKKPLKENCVLESGFWKTVRKNAYGFWQRIENSVMRGMPDCLVLNRDNSIVFVELKDLKKWQGDLGLSAEQRLWHRKWTDKGGRSFVLCRFERTFTIVDGSAILKSGTRLEWAAVAIQIWHGAIDWQNLEQILLESGNNGS